LASSGQRSAVNSGLFFAAAALLAAAAQDSPFFRTGIDLVSVPCVVTDSNGVPVPGLSRSDFHLFDNSVERDIAAFTTRADAPLTLGVLLDGSESQRSSIPEHETASRQFLERVLRTGEHGFVVRVGRDVTLVWEGIRSATGFRVVLLPAAGSALGEPCGQLHGQSLCGGTALWNGVYYAARLKLAKSDGAKALVILSDGADTGSAHSLDEASRECLREGVAVYSIRTGPAPGLTQLSRATGGADFDDSNYAGAFARIESDLRAQYLLAFHPGPSGVPHRIHVDVSRPGFTVRSRTEYTPHEN
jgi:VWFA-related protein